jgi:hypothetical protein
MLYRIAFPICMTTLLFVAAAAAALSCRDAVLLAAVLKRGVTTLS